MIPKASSSFRLSRAVSVARKEVFHIVRDPFTLALALGLPLFMVFVFGWAMEFNIRNIHMTVFDGDQTQTSRRMIEIFSSSNYFQVSYAPSPLAAQARIGQEKARVALIIPSNFERDMFSQRTASAQILIDGSDSSTVGPVLSYIGNIQNIVLDRLANFKTPTPIQIDTRYLFNPELNSKWFIVPGLIVVVMSILSILLTALTVAREWENGSMELLLTTPVKPIEIILGKLTPYGALGLIAVALVYVVARLVFNVPYVGNLLTLTAGCFIFLGAYLAQGLLISVITRKQQVAMQLAMMTGLLPAQLLSGFVFPIESMPRFFRFLTSLLPARWFMNISRRTFLMGSDAIDLKFSFLALSLIALFMIFMASKKFKRDLEP